MKKRILSLLLIICLAMGLLPVVALADAPSAKVMVAGKTLAVSAYDAPAYSVNTSIEVLDTDDNKFTVVEQTLAGASEENWNAKLVWKTGDTAPTLYLKGFQVDDYNEATEKWRARYQNEADRKDPEKKDFGALTTAISIPTKQPTNIVITGEDSVVKCRFGITYKSDLNIKSEGESKLTIHNLSSAITSDIGEAKSGYALNINANLDVSVESYYNSATSHIIQTYKADLTIEGGKINIDTPATKYLVAIYARDGGNVHIKGGTISAVSAVGTGGINGTIQADKGKVTIDGGDLKLMPKYSLGIYAKEGIEINGGKLYVLSPYYAVNAGTTKEPGEFLVNGGTVEFEAQQCCNVAPKLGAGVTAYVGANKENCELYDGTSITQAKKPWMIISNEKLDIVVTQPTEEGGLKPYVPTTPATTATTPTESVAPTGANGTADATNDGGSNSLVLWIVVAAVVAVAGAAVVLIVVKRKKA